MSSPLDIFDKASALNRVAGDEALLLELIEVARGHAAGTLPALVEAVEGGDTGEVQRLAHRLRSAFGNLGACRVYEATTELERAAARSQLQVCREMVPAIAMSLEEFFATSTGT